MTTLSFFKQLYFKMRASYTVALIYTFYKYGTTDSRKNVFVKEAGQKGQGLFTHKKFKPGAMVFIATGPVQLEHFTGEECYLYPDWYAVENGVWIDIQYPYVKINHSCSPNLGIDDTRTFVSLKKIKPSEELTFDYSTSDDELDWEMKCVCESQNCLGSIGPIQTITSERFAHAYPYIPNHFIKIHNQKKR